MQFQARYLYRGVNSDLYRTLNGKLTPKKCGEEFKRSIYYGEKAYYSSGVVHGPSDRNAVIMHQTSSAEYPSSGVSTTPVYENAVRYALHDHESGYVYKIDSALLDAHEVTAYPVDQHAMQPTIPGDQEVILVARDFGALPVKIIVDVEELLVAKNSPSVI